MDGARSVFSGAKTGRGSGGLKMLRARVVAVGPAGAMDEFTMLLAAHGTDQEGVWKGSS